MGPYKALPVGPYLGIWLPYFPFPIFPLWASLYGLPYFPFVGCRGNMGLEQAMLHCRLSAPVAEVYQHGTLMR